MCECVGRRALCDAICDHAVAANLPLCDEVGMSVTGGDNEVLDVGMGVRAPAYRPDLANADVSARHSDRRAGDALLDLVLGLAVDGHARNREIMHPGGIMRPDRPGVEF